MHGQTRARGLKFASMAVIVVLTLTGFSTGRGSSGGSSSSSSGGSSDGGGGGGCSSSSQDHDTSSSSSGGSTSGKSYDYDDNDDDYDDSYGDSSTEDTGSGEEQLEPATVRLVKCATVKEPYATVEVTNPNLSDAAFWVAVSFKDKNGTTIKDETWKIDVPADDKVTVDIEMARKSMASSLDHCVAEPEAEPTS
ncbi:hypothetical protein JIX56_26550 [Streptomyces sp. CA-210063]|uniref:hypothetical protein n=1 Tax=Streptomyces sp. CA-210063 TaxID=2801029 RepID=UPI00214AB3D9|nr:hypothetical protein [Streptomyces sp. CA-210063]UUU33143.1 hypothetical protein JIX56_26550 [Streptomyces sp. CA-210063]